MKHLVCAQVLHVLAKNTQAIVSNQNGGSDRNLRKSLSVTERTALTSRVNNTCVTPKRCHISKVRHVFDKREKQSAWAMIHCNKRSATTGLRSLVAVRNWIPTEVWALLLSTKAVWHAEDSSSSSARVLSGKYGCVMLLLYEWIIESGNPLPELPGQCCRS